MNKSILLFLLACLPFSKLAYADTTPVCPVSSYDQPVPMASLPCHLAANENRSDVHVKLENIANDRVNLNFENPTNQDHKVKLYYFQHCDGKGENINSHLETITVSAHNHRAYTYYTDCLYDHVKTLWPDRANALGAIAISLQGAASSNAYVVVSKQ